MKNLLLCLFLLLIGTGNVSAQDNDTAQTVSVVYFKDGSVMRGTVLEQIPDEYVKIRITGGSVLTVQMSEVERIKSDASLYTFHPDGSNSKTRGFYHGFNVQGTFGNPNNGEFDRRLLLGAGVQYSAGKQFNRCLSLGGGVGLEMYNRVFADIFVQVRGFLPLGKVTPVLAADAGYGAPVLLQNAGNRNAQIRGGWSLRPSIGLRIATRGRADLLVDAGYQLQEFHSVNDWGGRRRDEFDIWYRRLSFRMGWLF